MVVMRVLAARRVKSARNRSEIQQGMCLAPAAAAALAEWRLLDPANASSRRAVAPVTTAGDRNNPPAAV
jgi:hypothetical protein